MKARKPREKSSRSSSRSFESSDGFIPVYEMIKKPEKKRKEGSTWPKS